jgi:uncharacterized protein (DUF1800 family)
MNLLRLSLAAIVTSLSSGLLPAAQFDERVVNLSTRGQVGTGPNVMIAGFVVNPGGPKNVLIRAVGPGLARIGLSSGLLADPVIDVYNSSGAKILTSRDWTADLATTFTSVGAFSLATGSRDDALVATLNPGLYTALVSGVGGTSGLAMVEVYDVTGAARLINLSTRAQVGSGAGVLISGLVVAPGAGVRKVLIRGAGPTLNQLPGVTGALADPALTVFDVAAVPIATNDNWESAGNRAVLTAAFAQVGAFPFPAGSKDAALLLDLAPGNYTVHVSGVGNTTGLALVEAYDVTPDQLASVKVAATTATTDTKGAPPGVYTFTRTGPTQEPLTVFYALSGSAAAETDYAALPGSVTIPAGASSTTVNLTPYTDVVGSTAGKSATLSLQSAANYVVDGTASAASITIFYNPGTLYLAQLRTTAGVTNSAAYGTASVQLATDNTYALVNVTFSNLSSPQTVAYLRLGSPGDLGTELVRVPNGQATGVRWNIQPSGTYSAADIVNALKQGRVFLSIETATNPSGELRGQFIQSGASASFTAPADPPALADQPLTAAAAARFLTQATFGPKKADVDALTGKRLVDLRAWITAQMALAPSLHLDAVTADFNAFATGDNPQYSQNNRQAAWWKIAVTGSDQLRQRVALALSEILVVSDVNGTLFNNPRGLANYYDLLVRGAFGSFRTLLEDVTLSPIMGVYLSHLRNAKATYDSRGALLASPDENYAREIMQLFTIGLNELQPDGTPKLDPAGLPIPTYTQTTISETAKVFTGWAFYSADANPNFRAGAADYVRPMILYPAFHEDGAKTIVQGVQLPANQGGLKDLKDVLDTLFNHPNTGPFISRQLIQRLVTSNPSPGYVYRVAKVFADNGSGLRGDLGAVVRAILLDYEARTPSVADTAGFGKLKEPILRVTALLRAFDGASGDGRFIANSLANTERPLIQAALRAPTVFNFFEPEYVEPGLLAAAGLYAPEFQIHNDTTAISVPNYLYSFIYATRSTTNIGLTFDSYLTLAKQPGPLVDALNPLLSAGTIPTLMRDRIVTALNALPASTSDLERVRAAVYLVVSSPEASVQK